MIKLNTEVLELCITGLQYLGNDLYKHNKKIYRCVDTIPCGTVIKVVFESVIDGKMLLCKLGNVSHKVKWDGFNECKPVLDKEALKRIEAIFQHIYYLNRTKIKREKAFKKRKKIKCVVCGELFIPTNGRLCCSKECSAEWSRRRNHKVAMEKQKTYVRTCEVCGRTFITHTDKQVYCSKTCRIKRNNSIILAKKKAELHTTKKCLHCGKTFVGSPRVKYCCSKCREKHNIELRRNRNLERKETLIKIK